MSAHHELFQEANSKIHSPPTRVKIDYDTIAYPKRRNSSYRKNGTFSTFHCINTSHLEEELGYWALLPYKEGTNTE